MESACSETLHRDLKTIREEKKNGEPVTAFFYRPRQSGRSEQPKHSTRRTQRIREEEQRVQKTDRLSKFIDPSQPLGQISWPAQGLSSKRVRTRNHTT